MSISLSLFAHPLTHDSNSLQAIVYFSVRAAKEGLTVDILAQELQVDVDTPYESMGSTTEMVDSKTNETVPDVTETPAALDPSKETSLL